MRAWRIGRVLGIDLFIHWTFFLLPALVLFANLGSGVGAALLAVLIILTLFGCVVLHELGHALMARVYQIGTRDITLYPIGGVARLERMPESPGAEIAIALAGPAVNVAIAAGLFAGLWLGNIAFTPEGLLQQTPGLMFLITMLLTNIYLAVFNMLPAFPMDGGRVLRAGLTYFTGRLRATEFAGRVGTVFALLFVAAGLFHYGSPMLMFLGLFVWFAGQQELAMVRMQELARRKREAMGPIVTVESADSPPPTSHFTGFVWDPKRQVWVSWRDGHAGREYSVEEVARM